LSSPPELEEDDECEKREEAGEREASESELSRRSDAAPLDAHHRCSTIRGTSRISPPTRSSSFFRELTIVLPGD
jgi:hypothetical protein